MNSQAAHRHTEALPISPGKTAAPTFIELYTPKIVTVLREGYSLASFRADVVAGLTVAIVALPLSMAIAIASGVTPDRGLYTAIVGGFFVSLFGGSRFQVGGPAGAFIVLVAQTVQNHGLDGVILATMMAGVFLIAAGFLRLGTYVKFIPYPVTVGFTAGIAVIIFASQIKDLVGLTLPGHEPAAFLPKIAALGAAIGTINPWAVVLAAGTIVVMVVLRILRPSWPGILIGVVIATLAASMLGLPVDTIGSRFGGIPESLPAPSLPLFSLQKMQAVLPDAIAFALLGSIESLLSAVVADGMTGRRHRSNCELVAQGIGNIGSALFGGICVTGLIARTATNIRAGARSPVSGIMHSVSVLLFILIAAPLASYVPLCTLAAVLVVVAWTMAEKHEFATLVRSSWGDAAVLLSTFLLTVFRDLTEGIVVGFALGAMLFIHRMASAATATEIPGPWVEDDKADDSSERIPYDPALATDPDVIVYRISGAFFFGVASTIGAVLDEVPSGHKGLVIDFEAVPLLDSSAANVVARVAAKARQRGIRVILTGTSHQVRRELLIHGARPPVVRYRRDISGAVEEIKRQAALTASADA